MFCAGIIFMFYNLIIRAPKAKLVEEQLGREFNLIRPFPRAVAIDSEKSSKDAQALVRTRYSTDATYEEIQAYYNTEFTSHGWRYTSERRLTNWGRDLGQRTSRYCRDQWSAELEYLGPNSQGKQEYDIALAWYGGDCK